MMLDDTPPVRKKDVVDTDLPNIVCDHPITRVNHICRGLLYARCGV